MDRVRIAVVGPADIVGRLVQSAPMEMVDAPPYQLVGAPYTHERETVAVVEANRPHADAFLFTGPVPHDMALAVLGDRPGVHVPLNGASLYGCLLRGIWHGPVVDPSRVSIDTLTKAEVNEAFADIGLPLDGVLIRPHERSDTDGVLVTFHEEPWRDGRTVGAITGLKSVHDELERRGVPVARMRPSPPAIRSALRIVVLLAGSRGSDSRIAASVVALGDGNGAPDLSAVTGRWGDSLLSAHRVVREHARAVGALTSELAPGRFLLVGAAESLEQLFDHYEANPLGRALSATTGLEAQVGVGIAHAATTAFELAVRASGLAGEASTTTAWVVSDDGTSRAIGDMASRSTVAHRLQDLLTPTEHDYVVRLSEENRDTAEGDPVVSAESVASQLGMTERSARRLLDRLVEAGAAWELPPWRTSQRGRPPRRWRVAKIDPEPAAEKGNSA